MGKANKLHLFTANPQVQLLKDKHKYGMQAGMGWQANMWIKAVVCWRGREPGKDGTERTMKSHDCTSATVQPASKL